MDQVLVDLFDFSAAYLDDIVIYSESWEAHIEHLQIVFDWLKAAGLTINPSKCTFARAETECLGYVIGNGIIRPQMKKIKALESCVLPQTKTQLKSFLGMAGWYRRFIVNYSARSAILTDMTSLKGLNQLQWTEEAVGAFKDIQQALSKHPVLYSPNFEKKKKTFIVQTDASDRSPCRSCSPKNLKKKTSPR
ncbi:hypothetical protein LDENG_00156450 [Lucifuga dentata]|nr:hypothetical protein LDENG_00156450 [Lucifuga dentata]